MKLSYSISRGIALGFLTTVLGSVLVVIPTAVYMLMGPQAVYEPNRTILNIGAVIFIPLLNFFLHIIPIILSGIFVSYLWGKSSFSPLLKTLIAFLVILATAVFIVLMDPILFPSEISEPQRTLIDYLYTGWVEFCYIASFMLLAKKVLLPSGRNAQGGVN